MVSQPSESDVRSPAQADSEQLANLKLLVEQIIADGKITSAEADELRTALMADGQITPDEIDIVRTAMKARLGDRPPLFE